MIPWGPWKEWAERRAKADHERQVAREALERSRAGQIQAAHLGERLRKSAREVDAVADQIERAFQARPKPKEGGAR